MDVSDVSDYQIWANKGLHPLVNFNFTLQVEGIYNLPCKSVHVFQRENEYEYYQEGGLNDYVHMLRKPISKPMTFQVERYVGVDMLDPLALGTDLILPVLLSVSRYQGEGGAGGWEQPQRIYTFTGCTVIAKEFGELHAENAGLLVETTTIAYREMVCLDNPVTGLKKQAWNIKKDKDADGRPKTKHARVPEGMLSKAEMQERAQMYVDDQVQEKPMHVLDYKGKKVSSKKNYKTGETKIGIAEKRVMTPREDLEKEAKRYFLDGSVSRAKYKGIVEKRAVTQKEKNQAELEKQARRYYEKNAKNAANYKGKREASAATQEMEKRAQLEKKAKRYFLDGSISSAKYKGTIEKRAATEKELNRTQLEKKARRYYEKNARNASKYKGKRKASAARRKMEERAQLEKKARRYFLNSSKLKAAYKGTVKTSAVTSKQELRKEELQGMARRYFLSTSKLKNAYKGTIQQSAVTQKQMLGQAAMTKAQMEQAAKRRQWPPNRSAAQVAAFLKNKK